MKSLLLLGLALMTVQPTFARETNDKGLMMCLKSLNSADEQIRGLQDQMKHSEDNQKLREENSRLEQENRNLRNQLDMAQPASSSREAIEVVSYAACLNEQGKADLRYVAYGESDFKIKAGENAIRSLAGKFGCRFGAGVVETAPVYTKKEGNYCTAACIDENGVADTKFTVGGKGRNIVEAKYNALRNFSTRASCGYGLKIQACE